MARVMNPAIRVALILQAVAAGIAGAQAIFLRFERPTEETASAVIPHARNGVHLQGLHNVNYPKAGQVLAASSRPADRPRQ
jgi:hypothetical protein